MLLLATIALATTYDEEYGGQRSSYNDPDDSYVTYVEITAAGTFYWFGYLISSDDDYYGCSLYRWDPVSEDWENEYGRTAELSTWNYQYVEQTTNLRVEVGDILGMSCSGTTTSQRFAYDDTVSTTDPVWGLIIWSGARSDATTYTPPSSRSSYAGEIELGLVMRFITDDNDGDGADTVTDCDDSDATAFPGASETWYDGVDGDCDGADDFDQDGDGERAEGQGGGDCDDTDATVSPRARDEWYDGVDSDCDGADDYDRDQDGDRVPDGGGGDCDDDDPAVSSLAEEVWYDGFDQDCSGTSDFDQDGDGHDTPSAGGDDCDDTDATVALDCSGGGGGGGGGGGPGGGGIDWGDDDDDDDDDDEKRGGCLCMAGSAAPALPAATLAVLGVLRRRRRRRA